MASWISPTKSCLYLGLTPSSCQVRGLYFAGLLGHRKGQLSVLVQIVQGLGEMKALHPQGHSNSHESLQTHLVCAWLWAKSSCRHYISMRVWSLCW